MPYLLFLVETELQFYCISAVKNKWIKRVVIYMKVSNNFHWLTCIYSSVHRADHLVILLAAHYLVSTDGTASGCVFLFCNKNVCVRVFVCMCPDSCPYLVFMQEAIWYNLITMERGDLITWADYTLHNGSTEWQLHFVFSVKGRI